ncbi:MAG TPA: GC-type dockerin domain-anchored protein [Phycisphaerales bacterium]|nr:GC-type dockerin domain-anchored protein [Phycisphaerales bacterium]
MPSVPTRPILARLLSASFGVLALAAPLLAQPDITHADLSDTGRYPSTGGPINGKYAYAWGSYTCNIGNQNLSWINGGTPALAMNAYRLYDGRMMQIGLGNAKTACCVGNGSGCGLTCSTGGTGLRAGCRDYYSAGFNSGQSRLGPRSVMDAWTGVFTSIPAGTGDAIWRRCQVNVSDMTPANFPGATYFAEGVYVCTEEPPAQKLNNATYRPCAVANTGAAPTYNWTVQGASATGKPAIYAWKEHGLGLNQPDPSVTIVPVDVPGEGRYFVAAKVKDNADGTWRYDYAVFNLNSSRCGAAFSVPVSAYASISGIGVNAAPYHSGEIYDNTPWTGVKSGASVKFSAPAKYSSNPNTNALRWGTMHNYWFTANVPPAQSTGSVTIDLFKPGTPGFIVVAGLPVPSEVPCTADFDSSGDLAILDIFEYINRWFVADPRCDVNHANGVNEQDIFDFINIWFAGC